MVISTSIVEPSSECSGSELQSQDIAIRYLKLEVDKRTFLFILFYLKEEFCDQVKNRYDQVYHPLNMESNPSLSLQKQRAEVVKQLADTIFF